MIYLEPDKTVETVNGWFIVPLSPQLAFEWYQSEMVERGYVEQERSHTLPTWAMLRFAHSVTEVGVRISIMQRLRQTQLPFIDIVQSTESNGQYKR